MSTDDIALLTEYDEWKATKRVQRDDLSPEAFFIDRAKEQALQKLIKIADLMDQFYDKDWDDDYSYERGATALHNDISEVINE